jgi:hypothetical protein
MNVTAEYMCSDIAYSMYATRHGMTEEQVVQLWKSLGLYIASCLKCGKVWKPLWSCIFSLNMHIYPCGAVMHGIAQLFKLPAH